MALTKQKISLPFAAGLDTKTDDKQINIGSVTVLENMVVSKPGKYIKRNGYESVVLKTDADVAITTGEKLSTFKKELNLFTNTKMYSRISSIDKWSDKGNVFTVIPDSTPIVRNNVGQSTLDSVHVGGLNVFVYKDSAGVSVSLVDNESKNFILNRELISAAGVNPKVVARNNVVYIIYVDGTTIKYRKFSIFDFNNIDAEVTAVAAISATYKHLDAVLIGDRIMMAYSKTATDILAFSAIKLDDTMTSEVSVAGETPSITLNLTTDMGSRVICTYYDGSDAKIVIFNYTLGTKILAETSLETLANVTNITAIESTSENYTILYEVSATATYDHSIRIQTVDLAATLGTPAPLLLSLGLASKLFEHNDSFYFAAIHDNTLQSTYFLVDLNGNLVSKISPDTGGDVIASGGLPRISSIDDTKYLFTSQVKGRFVEENGTFFSLLGVNGTSLDFDPDSKFNTAALASNLHIAGGFLKMYDGTTVVEHGFHVYPEGLVNGGTAVTGGFMSDGAYQYKAVYAWTDAKGILHRSNPSVGFDVTLSGGGAIQTQTMTIPTLRLTDKSNVIIELYRTEIAGTIFYKVSSSSAPTANDKTVDTVNIIDTISDATLITQEILYTTGGELENIAAPPCSIIETFGSRVFVTTPESKKASYSKIQNEGFPVEFNDTLEINLPDLGGDNVVYKTMDDKLIMFKESSIHYLSGDGPNNLGEQDSFIEPVLISADIGCVNANSVVLSPMGIMFKSAKGIYLLGNNLSLDYIGEAVEEFNDLAITSAILVSNETEIRYTTSDGDCLVYNYHQNKWSTFSNHKALSAALLDSEYYYLKTASLLYKENDSYNDNGSYIKAKVESGWLSFAGVQNFQRVYKMLLLGEFKSDHKIRIRVSYDYVDAYIQEKVISVSDFTDDATYGEDSPYGASATYGAKNKYQFSLDFAKQKCESIKITIEDLPASIGEGMELSNILFVVGVKKSEFKVDSGRDYGTE